MRNLVRLIIVVIFIYSYSGCSNSSRKQEKGTKVLTPILDRELKNFISFIDSTCIDYSEKYSYGIYFYGDNNERKVALFPFTDLGDVVFENRPIQKGYFEIDSSIVIVYEYVDGSGEFFYDSSKLFFDTLKCQFYKDEKKDLIGDEYYCGFFRVYDVVNEDSLAFNRDARVL